MKLRGAHGLISLLGLLVCLATIRLSWPLAQAIVLPPAARVGAAALAGEHFAHMGDLDAYMDGRWPPLIAAGYPFAILLAVVCGLLVSGVLTALLRWSRLSLIRTVVGGGLGAVVGYILMVAVPLPDRLVQGTAMPVLALFFGLLVPYVGAQKPSPGMVRGTRVGERRGHAGWTRWKAGRTRQAMLAGAMLTPAAETRHVAVVGVTGTGKSVAIRGLLRTTMARGDRHVVADPDGGALALFFREGDVILNPGDARSAKWDLLAEIEEDSDYRLLAEAVVPQPRDERGSEWVNYAREVFASCFETWHRHELGSTDAFLAVMASAGQQRLAALCEGTPAQRYFEEGNERMLGSIMGTLAPALSHLRPLARVQGPPFSVRQWVREGEGTLWMPYLARQIPALRALISCWMGLAILETLSLPESRTRRVWFHVDELDALGRIQGLKDALARLRKVGGCVVLGLQSIAQVRAVYGEAEAHTIVENCDNKLILRCNPSEGGGTARFASEVIGEREVERAERSESRSVGRETSTSTSTAWRRQREPAVLDSEIMQLPDCTGYLKLSTRPDWLRTRFRPVDYPKRAEPFVPAARTRVGITETEAAQ